MLSQFEIYILIGIVALFGMGIAFTVVSMAGQPDMKAELGKRLAIIAAVEGLCLSVVIMTLLLVDL